MPKRTMRKLAGLLTLAVAALAVAEMGGSDAQAQPANQAPRPEDVLKNFVVRAKATQQLPIVAVFPALESNEAAMTIRAVVRRDLDLCGEFEVLPDSAKPDKLYLSNTPIDVKAWAKKGASSVVKVTGKMLPGGKAKLSGIAFFAETGDRPVYDKSIVVPAADVRAASHRIADALIGALTGTPGGFASKMTFVYGVGKIRNVYVMDADGHDPKPVSSKNHAALSPAFGPDGKVYYAASIKHAPYKVYDAGSTTPFKFKPSGSVYGIAFSPKGNEVALAIAVGLDIKVYRGPDLYHLKRASRIGMAMQPAFTPSGKLAFSGAGRWGQRIYLEGKPLSPSGLSATAPTFCRHPNGIRVVYAAGVGKNTDLVSSTLTGHGQMRLTQSQGRNNYPACSPDGRLVAFFSTRKTGEGPGLYVMRIDGGRPKRISTLVGRSLTWARLSQPKPKTPTK